MSGSRRHNLRTVTRFCALLGTVAILGACNERGLPGKNKPLADAANMTYGYPAYETMPASAKVITFDNHEWQVTGETHHVPANLLRSVTSVDGAELFALNSDAAPYGKLYSANPSGSYSVVARIR
jgi:hypothetical protein